MLTRQIKFQHDRSASFISYDMMSKHDAEKRGRNRRRNGPKTKIPKHCWHLFALPKKLGGSKDLSHHSERKKEREKRVYKSAEGRKRYGGTIITQKQRWSAKC